ncbi:hypothetical protein AVEN_127633-1 [Araneus ventricosus]|uniref:Uncharacterized protein n=1 Tax=Araneus ventricosus TaxID=182803 RepID=A0A4Y2P211_ARAVE|nr:hypothetical protein AVEN_127633-1 [Araneus ventricosus]
MLHSVYKQNLKKTSSVDHITLLWIPGHSTILWNEKADFIAKLGVYSGIPGWVPLLMCGTQPNSQPNRGTRIDPLVTEHRPYINWIASEDILSHMKRNSKKRTSGNCRDSKYYEELGEIPDIRSIFKSTKNRRENIICSRIFSKTLITPGLLNKFNLSGYPMCHTCNFLNNLDHILLHCSRYSIIRCHLWNKLGLVSSATYSFKELTSHVFEN